MPALVRGRTPDSPSSSPSPAPRTKNRSGEVTPAGYSPLPEISLATSKGGQDFRVGGARKPSISHTPPRQARRAIFTFFIHSILIISPLGRPCPVTFALRTPGALTLLLFTGYDAIFSRQIPVFLHMVFTKRDSSIERPKQSHSATLSGANLMHSVTCPCLGVIQVKPPRSPLPRFRAC